MSIISDNYIYFNLVRKVKEPKRANLHDAGIDFYMPEIDNKFIDDYLKLNPNSKIVSTEIESRIEILPNERVLIPSGVRVWINDKSSALIAANKSGLASKFGLIFTAQVVDSDYTGEIHLGILNTGKEVKYFRPGDKVIQFVHTPIVLSELINIDNSKYDSISIGSDRGTGGFGSTDNK